MHEISNEAEVYVRRSHMGLGIVIALILLLGAVAFVLLMWPSTAKAALAGRATALLPIAITIAVAILLRPSSVKGFSLSGPGMKAVLRDELRLLSLSRAYRNGFIAVLTLQPLLAVLLTYQTPLYAVALMASTSVTVGAIVVLASVLWYDR